MSESFCVQATTPLDPRVLDKMLPYFTSYYGNPHSVSHAYGWQAEATVENARMQVLYSRFDIKINRFALSDRTLVTVVCLKLIYVDC